MQAIIVDRWPEVTSRPCNEWSVELYFADPSRANMCYVKLEGGRVMRHYLW
jgi:hypothetical protein